jgi:predicted transposase YdaD
MEQKPSEIRRQKRLQELEEAIRVAGIVDIRKLQAELMLKWGVSLRQSREMVDILELLGRVKRYEDGSVAYVGGYNERQDERPMA